MLRSLLLVALLAPLATAQPTPTLVTLEVGALPPSPPLQSPVSTELTLTASCAILQPPLTNVHFRVTSKPTWSTAIISPLDTVLDPAQCGPSGTLSTHATVHVTTTDAAPGFRPAPIVITATVQPQSTPEHSASATTNVTASYFSRLDVTVADPVKTVQPRETTEYAITIHNHGNAATRVRFETINVSPGLDVTLPGRVVVGAKQQGDANEKDEVVRVLAWEGSEFTNTVGSVNVRFFSESVEDGTQGENGTLSLLLTTRGAAVDTMHRVPEPLPLAAFALVAGVVLLRRRT